MAFIVFLIFFAVMNRARGSNFAGMIALTTVSRLLAMGLMACATVLHYLPASNEDRVFLFSGSLALLMLWCIPAWDAYWGACVGQSPKSKLWGLGMMTARMSLILPYYAFLAGFTGGNWHNMVFSLSFLSMGLTYIISGIISSPATVVRNPELANGAIIGATAWAMGM